jgi:hypothetical protein
MRKFAIFTQVVFVLAGLLLIILPAAWLPDYYKPIPMGLLAIGYSFIIQLPIWLFRRLRETDVMKQFQAVLALDLLLCSIGSLGGWGWYQYNFPYDRLVHFVFPATMMYFGALLFASYYRWSLKKSALIVLAIIVLSGIAWEFIESFSAVYFHFGYFGALFDDDSKYDILTNIFGIVSGLIYLKK